MSKHGTVIEWTHVPGYQGMTWNPVTGCTKVSEGCRYCYAERIHDRRHKDFLNGKDMAAQYAAPFGVVQNHPARYQYPQHWRDPRAIFVASGADLFHKDTSEKVREAVFTAAYECPRHIFMVLTKRADEMLDWVTHNAWLTSAPLTNVWFGVSVEDQATADERILLLLQTPAAVRFVSYEPALGPVDFSRALGVERSDMGMYLPEQIHAMGGHPRLDWIIAGGESGLAARAAEPEWFRHVQEQCAGADVPYFFKQWGEWDAEGHRVGKKAAGHELDGITFHQWPKGVVTDLNPA